MASKKNVKWVKNKELLKVSSLESSNVFCEAKKYVRTYILPKYTVPILLLKYIYQQLSSDNFDVYFKKKIYWKDNEYTKEKAYPWFSTDQGEYNAIVIQAIFITLFITNHSNYLVPIKSVRDIEFFRLCYVLEFNLFVWYKDAGPDVVPKIEKKFLLKNDWWHIPQKIFKYVLDIWKILLLESENKQSEERITLSELLLKHKNLDMFNLDIDRELNEDEEKIRKEIISEAKKTIKKEPESVSKMRFPSKENQIKDRYKEHIFHDNTIDNFKNLFNLSKNSSSSFIDKLIVDSWCFIAGLFKEELAFNTLMQYIIFERPAHRKSNDWLLIHTTNHDELEYFLNYCISHQWWKIGRKFEIISEILNQYDNKKSSKELYYKQIVDNVFLKQIKNKRENFLK